MLARFHHALADGIRLTQLMLSLCDLDSDALPPRVGRSGSGLLSATTALVRRSVTDGLDVARGMVALPARMLGAGFGPGWELLTRPRSVIDVLERLGSEGNATVNTLAEITRVLTAARSVETSWSGEPGVTKTVSWITDLDLDLIKALGRLHGGTVNDVLLAVVSRAVSAYLAEKGGAVDEIHWMVPVSLQPLDAELPKDLGNHFSLVFLPMPLTIDDTASLIGAIRERMQRIKSSAEPVITFGVQWVIAESPKSVAVALTNLFANKGVGVLTNVPGPRGPMSLAGAPVAGTLGWAPTSGDQPLSLCLFSYHGSVNIGIAADAGLIPDPDRIAELLRDSFVEMIADLD
jgi:diacylglycerol O-acyltransferase